ncbi:MAG: hypothetical protein HC850_08275 [Rhodomicrobium sp.]|nr:hypothetical protein [Rhodomicrobium sp.]
MPSGRAADFNLADNPDLYAHIPDAGKNGWPSLSMIAGACGGCGAVPVKADIEFFSKQWLGQAGYAKVLLDADMTHSDLPWPPTARAKSLQSVL